MLGSSVSFYDPNSRPSYNSRWSFGFQRQVTPTIAVEVNYVGSSGFHIPTGSAGNGYSAPSVNENTRQLAYLPSQYLGLGSGLLKTVPNPFRGLITSGALSQTTITKAQLLTTYPEFSGVSQVRQTGGSSTYHSLQVTATKRASHGFSLLSTYTFSKQLDRYRYINPSDPGPSRMVGEYAAPRRITVGGVYELPFGRGRTLGWNKGVAGELISKWQIAVNGVFQSGFPITLGNGLVQTSARRSIWIVPTFWTRQTSFTSVPFGVRVSHR